MDALSVQCPQSALYSTAWCWMGQTGQAVQCREEKRTYSRSSAPKPPQDRISIVSNAERIPIVTMKQLQISDSGVYWCALGSGRTRTLEVVLSVFKSEYLPCSQCPRAGSYCTQCPRAGSYCPLTAPPGSQVCPGGTHLSPCPSLQHTQWQLSHRTFEPKLRLGPSCSVCCQQRLRGGSCGSHRGGCSPQLLPTEPDQWLQHWFTLGAAGTLPHARHCSCSDPTATNPPRPYGMNVPP